MAYAVPTTWKAAEEPARSYQDYEVTVDEADLPEGVTCTRMS